MRATGVMLVAVASLLHVGSGVGHAQIDGGASRTLSARFFREPAAPPSLNLEIPPPSSQGKIAVDELDWTEPSRRPVSRAGAACGIVANGDVFVASGAENALAIDVGDGDNLVAVLNLGFTTSPSMSASADGNVSWTTRTFPNGAGTYTGFPFDPWASPGNGSGRLFAMLIRRDTASSNAHCVIARSIDGGVTWPGFYEHDLDVFQDRAMFDVDRSESLGGGPGSTHDRKIYLCYDNYGPNFIGYTASALQVVSPGGVAMNEIVISTAANFNGSWLQPVAGVTDGQAYLMGLATSGGGASRILRFHEVTQAGLVVALNKSSMVFPTTGQRLGASSRYGVNGHRINAQMFMEIDRTAGRRRGFLYVISNRNPNPFDPSLDQGDVYLSVSMDGAGSWSSALLPGQAAGKTQFFAMMDVDDNGWLHAAYYQNETGSVDGGVLNASKANLYYTLSVNGGETWTPHVAINDPGNALDYSDPPPDLSWRDFYLIGDYCRIMATTDGGTRAYVYWSGYDKDFHPLVGQTWCTTISICLADLNGDGTVGIQDLFILFGNWGPCAGPCPPYCTGDLDNDCTVGITDLFILFGNWG